MKAKRSQKMRELRKAHNPALTLQELARRAGISYTTVWNLENGYDEKVNPEIMHKVARILGVEAMDIFPSEEARAIKIFYRNRRRMEDLLNRITKEDLSPQAVWRIMKQEGMPIPYHHRFLTLMDICPGLDFEYDLEVDDILRLMSPAEVRDLFRNCVTPEEAVEHLNRAAKRLGAKPVRIRKR